MHTVRSWLWVWGCLHGWLRQAARRKRRPCNPTFPPRSPCPRGLGLRQARSHDPHARRGEAAYRHRHSEGREGCTDHSDPHAYNASSAPSAS